MFAAFGTVQSAQVIMDRETGRSKGFGFVEMSSDAEAQAAIAGLSGKSVGGRNLTVPRVRKLGLELHLGAGGGTRAEVLPLLAHRPESLSADDPARLVRTLAE